MNDKLSHLDKQGRIKMVDVGSKPAQRREALAEAILVAAPATLNAIMQGNLPKGEALATARIAGIQAAKKCDELIPLCHTLPLDAVAVDFERTEKGRLRITTTATTTAKTGVEMEALVAASIAALTIYDMAKAIDKHMRIEHVVLISKKKSD
jgi:cyclic pyranopterin phosphate synthase